MGKFKEFDITIQNIKTITILIVVTILIFSAIANTMLYNQREHAITAYKEANETIKEYIDYSNNLELKLKIKEAEQENKVNNFDTLD